MSILLYGVGTVHAAPILFVTHTPDNNDFANSVAVFGNHRGDVRSATRGGDLYIRYDDSTLRNLTEDAGYGLTAATEITVRDPCVHWDGEKALFSMAVGGSVQGDAEAYFQIYEITGILQGETAVITKLNQPEDYNNVSPVYGTDDRILFTTDRPRNGDRRLYPQLDEYESTPTNTGLWRMNPDGSSLEILDHSPSGNFTPIVDSFGRIVFTRWDHLQRDQQTDGDINAIIAGNPQPYGTRVYESEESDTYRGVQPGDEIFPDHRVYHGSDDTIPDPTWDTGLPAGEQGLRLNHFFPWMINEDGTELETLNHVGRHELFSYTPGSRNYLPDHNITDPHIREAMLQVREDYATSGWYYGTNAPEFGTHASGQIVRLYGAPDENPDDMRVEYVTNFVTRVPLPDSSTPTADHVGLFRDPMPASDGTLWAAHSESPFRDDDVISQQPSPAPYVYNSRYNYRVRKLEDRGDGVFEPADYLIPGGVTENVSYFDNFRFRDVEYNGLMWELQPVEVVARTRPTPHQTILPSIETNIIHTELGGTAGEEELRQWLRDNELALVVSRDVTVRADEQQDYRLGIEWSSHETTDGMFPTQELAWMQFFEGLQIRGYDVRDGRRVLAKAMETVVGPENPGAPTGSVRLGDDGSMAAFVPASRALSWQTTDMDGLPVVRERYWLTFQPGEIRSCANCHGLNRDDVFGNSVPTNDPEALVELLQWWKGQQPSGVDDWMSFGN